LSTARFGWSSGRTYTTGARSRARHNMKKGMETSQWLSSPKGQRVPARWRSGEGESAWRSPRATPHRRAPSRPTHRRKWHVRCAAHGEWRQPKIEESQWWLTSNKSRRRRGRTRGQGYPLNRNAARGKAVGCQEELA
jgi:phage terminase large subunit GpA-like protein